MPTENPALFTCDICGSKHQMGPNIYNGKFIPAYKMQVCKSCFEMNWDGWAPRYEKKLLAHLDRNGIAHPKRNSDGLIPRGK